MSRRSGKRAAKDAKREAARQKRQEQAERTRSAEPIPAGKTGQLNLNNASDVRMAEMAIRKGWIFPDKFFETIPKRIQEAAGRDGLSVTAVARLTKAAAQLYGQAAAAVDKEDKAKEQPQAVNVNVGVGVQIQVNESDDWYGSRPNKHAENGNGFFTEGNGTPMPDSVVAGSVQGGSVRPAVGQNGVGTNGHGKGPRDLPGPATGSG